ncbi:hypothetical protein H7F50_07335 [Novosphingobium flavum]|nr:hypothetical protein [Novosphingobium aerophilum]MBC2661564.1 hypothetical protein [Novosphingobium aerophilum]
MKANRVSCAGLALALLGGCAGPANPPPPAAPPPAPRPVAPPPPAAAAPPADWRDAPRTPGTWRWAMEAGRSTARYGLPGEPSLASLACDPASRTTILWTNRTASGPTMLTITATSTRRALTASPAPDGGMAVSLPARDPLNDAMAFSRGRFMLEVAGFPALYLPAWAEVGRVIEDCRAGG